MLRQITRRLKRRPVWRLDAAAEAYLRAPGTDTLLDFVAACGPALHDVARRRVTRRSAAVVQQAALAYSHAHHRLGGAQYAEVAAELLQLLADRAPGTAERRGARMDLATLEFTRYQENGGTELLRRCVARYEQVLQESPADFPYRAVLLGGLGNALVELGELDGRLELVDRAVTLHEQAVLAGDIEIQRTRLLVNLATALLSRYRITQRPSDLRRASEVHDQLAARDDVDEQVLVARAQLLWERYAAEDDADLLTKMIAILEPVVAGIPDDVPLWRSAALDLANARLEVQWRFGGPDTAGPLLAAAARRTPRASPLWARLQHAEGLRRWQDYLTSGDLSRLAEALVAWREAAASVPVTHVARAALLNSVAVGVLQQASHAVAPDAGAVGAVDAAREAVAATAPGTVSAAAAWSTLGNALSLRHQRTGDFAYAQEAVTALRTAVESSTPGSRNRGGHLGALAVNLRERAAAGPRDDAPGDLLEAVALHRQAIKLMAQSTELPGLLADLGMTLHGLASVTTDLDAYREAVTTFRQALDIGLLTAPGQAVSAALGWRQLAMDGEPIWTEVAAACGAALLAIRLLLDSQAVREDKESWLRSMTDVAALLARAHVELDRPADAVLALEGGRGLLMSAALPPIGLEHRAPDLLSRFLEASAAVARLEQSASVRQGSAAPPGPPR